ncbi:acyl-CoA dehydrogenase family protein [Kitasatospora sp. NPDC002040]|uniref:acyl-CoA dehydrogenase family protein n=1 Tax=Kitasatospora sp. NPDC002040 TaxID=3154661 RepID=UPI00331D4540
MTTAETQAQRAELVGRATDLVGLIRTRAAWQEENRLLHDEVLQGLVDAGLFRLRVPKRYGGYESDVRTVCEVIAELARGDGSVGWTASTLTIGSWLVGLFPDEVQDEIFADPDALVGSSVSPNGIAVPTDGGVVLNGKWAFSTGALHSRWFIHSALLATEDGGHAPVMVAVPLTDLTVVDDWYTSGLRGTGSVTTVVRDLFVPGARVLPLIPVLAENRHRSKLNAAAPMWRIPFSPITAAGAAAVPLGLARAALEVFLERLPERRISYTHYERQSEAPITHLQVAEARMRIDEAEFHVRRAAGRVDGKSRAGEAWSLEERAVARMDMGASCLLGKEAVDLLNTASGGSSIYSDQPMQRIERDIQTVNLHGVLHPNTNLELYGRVLCGLEPNTQLI